MLFSVSCYFFWTIRRTANQQLWDLYISVLLVDTELAESAVKLKALWVFLFPSGIWNRSVNVIDINLKDKQNGQFAPARPAA